MDDAVTSYMRASEANDIDAMMETLAPNAELVSPISGHMVFRGTDDLRVLLTAVYGSMTGLRWGRGRWAKERCGWWSARARSGR